MNFEDTFVTSFEDCLTKGKAKVTLINKIRAISLIKSSKQAIETAKIIPLTSDSAKSIFRELYEGLREFCEALGFLNGYKFSDHISITYFLNDVLREESISKKFDRLRRLRNGANYYGDDLDVETVKESLKEIPNLIKQLEKYGIS